jgi:hypothetical protein
VRESQTFRVAAVCWVIYALGTASPVLSYPDLLVQTVVRSAFGILIAAFFWFRPGRGVAILGTVLGFASIPYALGTVLNFASIALAFLGTVRLEVVVLLLVGPSYWILIAAALLAFVASAYCWWLTTRSNRPTTE